MAQVYGLLDQNEEGALYTSRLLNVEEKPFKRISKRLLAPTSLLSTCSAQLPTPPPDASGQDGTEETLKLRQAEHEQFREDVTLDFAAFENSLARIQFLLTSNEKERERYAAEKVRILGTAQEIRESTAELRVQLDEARSTMAVRKTWDELTEKITSNRMLRPREDQHANLEKLNAEIADLERESTEYTKTWAERRDQFGRIMKEGMELRRLIRDEKEEVERREGMEGGEEGEEAGSHLGTPRPEAGGGTPLHRAGTPAPTAGVGGAEAGQPNVTSAPGMPGLRERPTARSQRGTPQPTAPASPQPEGRASEVAAEAEDEEMAEQGEIAEDDAAGTKESRDDTMDTR